jgi:hypothetical protein
MAVTWLPGVGVVRVCVTAAEATADRASNVLISSTTRLYLAVLFTVAMTAAAETSPDVDSVVKLFVPPRSTSSFGTSDRKVRCPPLCGGGGGGGGGSWNAADDETHRPEED